MKFLDIEKHTAELNEHIKALQSYEDVLEAEESRITLVLSRDDVFKGEGATGIINYHEHILLPAIRSLRTYMDSFIDTLEKIKGLMTEFEPESNGSVSSEFWGTNLPNSYNNYEEAIQDSEREINSLLDSISHVLELDKLQTEDVYTNVQGARDHADKVLEGLNKLDQAGVDLMALVRTKIEEINATIDQVIEWTAIGGVRMNGVNIMEVGGYFANQATLHKGASAVDTSKVKAGVTEPELKDNPSLLQWATHVFDQLTPMDDMYTVGDAGMKASAFAFQKAMNLDKKFGSPVMTKMSMYGKHIMTDPRAIYGNYYWNKTMDGMRNLGNKGMTVMSGINQWYQGAKSNMQAKLNGMTTAVTNTKTGQSVMGFVDTVASNKYVAPVMKGAKAVGKAMGPLGIGISVFDNVAEFWREENSGKTGLEKTGRMAGGLAVDFGSVALGAAIGTAIMPGVGTAVGAFIGGVAAVGANIFTGDALTNKARDLGEAAARKVGEAADAVGKATVKAAAHTVHNVVNTVDDVVETGKQALETGKEAVDAVGGFFSGVGDFITGNAR